MPSEIAVPFRLDTNGQVVMINDLDAMVRQHVLALLNTAPVERPMISGYGTNINRLMFEDMDGDEVAAQATILIRESFAAFEPGVRLVKADPDYDKSQDNLSVVNVEYQRLDAPDSGDVMNMNSAIIGANGVVREIVRG